MISMLMVMALQVQDTITVVTNEVPTWGQEVHLVEEARVGSIDGPEYTVFGMIIGAAISPDGSMIVADMQVPVLRQFGADGSWIRNIGREGRGPGEYNLIYGVKQLESAPLTILDPRNARVTRYIDGDYSSSFQSLSGLHAADLLAVDTTGHTYVKTVIRDPSAPLSQPGEEWRMGWIRFDQRGVVVDTVQIPLENEEGGGFVLSGKGGYFRPFTTMTVSTFSPHGYLVWARNDEYAVHYRLPDGRIRRIERRVDAVPVSREERAQWEDWVEYFGRRSRESGRRESFGPIPRTKPFIRHLFVDDDGRIWVAVYAPARFKAYTEEQRAERKGRPSLEWNQPLLWDILTPTGEFLARIALPDGTSLLAARGDTVLGSQSGEWDEEYVVRFRIEGRRLGG